MAVPVYPKHGADLCMVHRQYMSGKIRNMQYKKKKDFLHAPYYIVICDLSASVIF
jgi:hypothetical protein